MLSKKKVKELVLRDTHSLEYSWKVLGGTPLPVELWRLWKGTRGSSELRKQARNHRNPEDLRNLISQSENLRSPGFLQTGGGQTIHLKLRHLTCSILIQESIWMGYQVKNHFETSLLLWLFWVQINFTLSELYNSIFTFFFKKVLMSNNWVFKSSYCKVDHISKRLRLPDTWTSIVCSAGVKYQEYVGSLSKKSLEHSY